MCAYVWLDAYELEEVSVDMHKYCLYCIIIVALWRSMLFFRHWAHIITAAVCMETTKKAHEENVQVLLHTLALWLKFKFGPLNFIHTLHSWVWPVHRGPGCRKLVHKPKLFWPSLNFVWILWAPGPISTCEKGQKCRFYWIFWSKIDKKSTENCSKSQNFHLQSWKYTDMTRFRQIEAQDDHIHI